MDEATRTGRPAVEHQRGPDEIREDIEQMREELGETVEALAAKTDVRAQARAKVEEARRRALAKAEAVRARAASSSNGALAASTPRRSQQLRAVAGSPATYVVIGAVAGILLGVAMARR